MELTRDPQTAMKKAFEKAHIGIRAALVEKYKKLKQPLTETAEGFLIEQDGQPVDGGSTATVVALLQVAPHHTAWHPAPTHPVQAHTHPHPCRAICSW